MRRDVVLCGANGFTGTKILSFLAAKRSLSMGVTCRSEDKVRRVTEGLDGVAGHATGIDDAEELSKVLSGYKVVINCIGPYEQTGFRVMDAALKAKTHYIDFSGEPKFIKESYQRYNAVFREGGMYAVHACGFDSMPVDIGILYAAEVLGKMGSFSSMEAESYLSLVNCRINLGTFRTALNSYDTAGTKDAAEEKRPSGKSGRKKVRKLPFYSAHVKKYSVLFPGSDSFILKMTKSLLAKETALPDTHCYLAIGSLLNLLTFAVFVSIIAVFSLARPLRDFTYRHIDSLSFGRIRREGPKDSEIAQSRFATTICLTGRGEGSGRVGAEVEVSGPDPGYVTTPICVAVALDLLLLKGEGGGVYSPGALFYGTDVVGRLEAEGVKFRRKEAA